MYRLCAECFILGLMTLISPCHLPTLPIYVTYLAGTEGNQSRLRTLFNALGFLVGFAVFFVALGAAAGIVGELLWARYRTYINIVTGVIVVIFGLSFLGVFHLHFHSSIKYRTKNLSFFSAVLFGIILAVSWTPCCSATVGSALMMAGNGGSLVGGMVLLLAFSLGLGLPFFLCAVLVNGFTAVIKFIKRHYRIINIISGVFLVVIGVLMALGYVDYFHEMFE